MSLCIDPRNLDLGTSWRWVVSFTPRPFYPGTHCTGGWVGPRTGLDGVEKIKIFLIPGLELLPLGHSAHNQLVSQVRPRPPPFSHHFNSLFTNCRIIQRCIIGAIGRLLNKPRVNLLLLPWRIRPPGLFPLRINSEIINLGRVISPP
jgi:hypothetical protein